MTEFFSIVNRSIMNLHVVILVQKLFFVNEQKWLKGQNKQYAIRNLKYLFQTYFIF